LLTAEAWSDFWNGREGFVLEIVQADSMVYTTYRVEGALFFVVLYARLEAKPIMTL